MKYEIWNMKYEIWNMKYDFKTFLVPWEWNLFAQILLLGSNSWSCFHSNVFTQMCSLKCVHSNVFTQMCSLGWLRLVGSLKLQVSFATEPYKRDYILQKRPIMCLHKRQPTMGWLRLVGSLKLQVSFAKKPYKRDDILQKRPVILRSLLIVATPYSGYHQR